ncbi:MAG: sialic acid synthase [Candidatus Desulfobacillus denitrificans]|nr:MAG: N-acetylneuraminate synthase [Rhodocyclaceae bacterium]CAG0927322.1 N-acetylneuraminate synthase [Rhodocyclaceae bacterium]
MIRIIAEIGSVHDGSFGNALKLIEAAAAAGADAVKFQTHIAEAESLESAPAPAYFSDEPRLDYFRRTAFTPEQWRKLAAYAKGNGIVFLSSPFSLEAVDLLEEIGMAAYKIPSGEVSNKPLLERVARTGKPVLLSSGMSGWDELDLAVATVRNACATTVMQCSSTYPCPPERVGLNVIREMSDRYGLPVGYSDHTMGFAAPVAAAALGATVIEKHFTFSRLMYGSDARHSMQPDEFKAMAHALRDVWTMLGNPVSKADIIPYADMKRIFEKSVVTARAIASGETVTADMLAFKKPGDGIPAREYARLIGRNARRALPANHKISEDDLN